MVHILAAASNGFRAPPVKFQTDHSLVASGVRCVVARNVSRLPGKSFRFTKSR